MAAAAAKAEDGRRRACAAVKPVSLLKTVSALSAMPITSLEAPDDGPPSSRMEPSTYLQFAMIMNIKILNV